MEKRNRFEIETEVKTAFAAGYTTAFIEFYARAHGLPVAALADRVGQTLQLSQGREVLGVNNRMPEVPRATAKGSSASRSLALARSPRAKVRRNKGANGAVKFGKTKATAMEVLKDLPPSQTSDLVEEMMRRNPKIASAEAAAQVFYKMKKDGALKQDRKHNWLLNEAA